MIRNKKINPWFVMMLITPVVFSTISCSTHKENNFEVLSTKGQYINTEKSIYVEIEGKNLPLNESQWNFYDQKNEKLKISDFKYNNKNSIQTLFFNFKNVEFSNKIKFKINNSDIEKEIIIKNNDNVVSIIQTINGIHYENLKKTEIIITGILLPQNKQEWNIHDKNNNDLSQNFDFRPISNTEVRFVRNDSIYTEKLLVSIPKQNIVQEVNVKKEVASTLIQNVQAQFYTKHSALHIDIFGDNLPENKNLWRILNMNNEDITTNFDFSFENKTKVNFTYKQSDYLEKIKILVDGIEKEYVVTKNDKINFSLLDYIDPIKNPNKFNDKHLFQLEEINKINSVHQLIAKTPLFQSSLNNVYYQLLNYRQENDLNIKGFNFINAIGESKTQMIEDFFKIIKDIGIFGDYQLEDIFDLIKFYPDKIMKDFFITQKYLPNPSNEMKNNSVLLNNVSKEKINETIKNNIFGYLPSNLSQFLYYLNLNEIANLFNINAQLKTVYSEFDDKKGFVELFFETTENNKYKYILSSSDFSSLKKVKDFKQFIYDRSFIFKTSLWDYRKINPIANQGFIFKEHILSGSAWVLDRIHNPILEKEGKYEFLVGSNLHVFNLTKGFEKSNVISNKYYVDNWNGGFVAKHKNSTGDGWVIEDQIEKYNATDIAGFSYETLKKAKRRVPVEFLKYDIRDVEELENKLESSPTIKKTTVQSSTIGSDNYLDLVWYTPDFQSDNIRARNDSNSDYFFGEGNVDNNFMGTLVNGGADFAIAKVVLSRDEINKLIPSLLEVLNTKNEKDWYTGLGNDELLNPNQTILIGGFPENEWQSSKSIGGIIKTRDRLVETANSFSSNESQKYWTRYNEKDNLRLNTYNQRAQWYSKNFRDDFGHGMAIEKMIQNSIYYTNLENNEFFLGGASGSMAIDSRFNIQGVLFSGLFPPNDSTRPFTNSIALFKQHSKYKDWNGSIKQDVISKLKKEKTWTLKLNPK